MAADSPIARLNDYGQSPWYDNIRRLLLVNGELLRLIEDDGIRGVTSNPTIIDKALSSGDDYEAQLRLLVCEGQATEDIYWDVVLRDITDVAGLLRPVYNRLDGADGFVSIEVDPRLARETDATLVQLRWLHDRLRQPNVMVKVPATAEGLPVIEDAIAEGRNVNVTLIFALARYDQVIEAYLRGLERLTEGGGDPSRVGSVASFFVSRVDTETDRRLPEGHPLRGRAAVANAKLAYRLFEERFSGPRWEALAAAGARVQRPLWASTSTKSPAYSDTLYVDELIGPNTVNTLAPASIEALHDHGDPQPDTIRRGLDDAAAVIAGLAEAGVDFDDVTRVLEEEGVAAFAASHIQVLETIGKRAEEIRAG
jgi:transaldolase